MILQTVDKRISEHEKKIGRQLEHKFDAKIITINEVLIDIKTSTAAQPRLSKAEDELINVKRELQVSDTATSILNKCYYIFITCILQNRK
jgi:hypothetical protein